MDVAAIIVGDEVLSGHVEDRNGPLLARLIREAGQRLVGISIVPDEIDVIGREIRVAMERGSDLVITSGGVGPTHDDVTLRGVAEGLGSEMQTCEPMLTRIDSWVTRATASGVSEEGLGAGWLRRMSLAPAGAELLECSIPVPAFRISSGNTEVFVLPGPPAQFEIAFRDAVLPLLTQEPSAVAIEEVTHPLPESMVAQVLFDVCEDIGDVSIGSYPLADGVLLRIKGPQGSVADAADRLRKEIDRIVASDDGVAMMRALEQRRGRN